MAIDRKQRLVNLHTSAMTTEKRADLLAALNFGEIAVAHGASATSIFTKAQYTGEEPFLAEFIDEAAVKSLINAEGVEGIKTRVSALEGLHVSGYTVAQEVASGITNIAEASTSGESHGVKVTAVTKSGSIKSVAVEAPDFDAKYDEKGAASSAKTEVIGAEGDAWDSKKTLWALKGEVAAEVNRAGSAENTLQSNINAIYTAESGSTPESGVLVDKIAALDATVSGENASKQIKVEVVEVDGKLSSLSVVADKFDVDGAASSAKTEVIGKTTDEWDEAKTLWAVKNAVDAEAVRAKGVEGAISGDVTTIQSQLDGFGTSKGSVKTYVDGKVVGLLHFIGSVATTGDLPTITSTAVTHGDVYNIQQAFIYDGQKYPAGTNVVAIKLDEHQQPLAEPYWDALGGTVDLEPYAKKGVYSAATASEETVAGAKKYADEIGNGLTSRVDAVSGNVATNATNIATISGDVATVSASVKTNKDTIDAYTVNGIAISTNPVLYGSSITLSGYVKAASAAAIAATDKVDVALGKLEYRIEAEASVLTDYKASNDSRVKKLEDLHVSGKTVAQEVTDGINAIAEKSLSGESHGVKVTAVTASGSIKSVAVEAPDFDAKYDEKGAASSAYTSATTYADGIKTGIESKYDGLLGTGFTSGSSVTEQLKAVKTTADSAVQSVTLSGLTNVSAVKTGTDVAIDFTNMTIDCGEF